jgi:hypothetical protein
MMLKFSVPTSKERKRFLYKDQFLMLSREITTVYYENHTKPINTLYRQNAEALYIAAGDTVL